ncbi:alanine racemase [candidate division SR1 bacterium]|nr:alanine racemase [candidate division SR1 bacterium]
MLAFFKSLLKPQLEPMNTIYLHKKALLSNLEYLKSLHPQSEIFPILKSNAYGHGIQQILTMLKGVKVPYIIVDSFPEYQIIHAQSKHSILILGETLPKNYSAFDFKRATFAVYNLETLHALGKMKKKLKIHIFLNTGMNREGVQTSLLLNFLETLKAYPRIEVDGVMSHLHSANSIINDGMNEQIDLFKQMHTQILQYGHAPKRRHIGSSAGLLKMQDDFFNARRPGITMYGYNPLNPADKKFDIGANLTPILSLSSTVVSLQKIDNNQGVGYSQQRKKSDNDPENTEKFMTIATIPFGYFEGLPRILREKISFRRNGKECQQIGSICMNLCSFIGEPEMLIGDKIWIVESDKNSVCSIQNLSDKAETIPYEILVGLERGIRREIV